jgi:hypothetical protein
MVKSISAYIKNISKKPGYASLLIYLTPENSPLNSPVTSPALPTRTPPNTPVTSPSTTTTTPASTPGGTSGNSTEVYGGEKVNILNNTMDDKLDKGGKIDKVNSENEVPIEGANFKQAVGSNTTNSTNTSGNITQRGDSGSSDLLSPMDQFEIHPFLGNLFGLNYTPLGLITNILVYIGLAVSFILLFYIYGSFKDNIKING